MPNITMLDIEELKSIIAGTSTEEKAIQLIERMGEVYPLDHTQMYLLKDDTLNGARFMSAEEYMEKAVVWKKGKIDKTNNFKTHVDMYNLSIDQLHKDLTELSV